MACDSQCRICQRILISWSKAKQLQGIGLFPVQEREYKFELQKRGATGWCPHCDTTDSPGSVQDLWEAASAHYERNCYVACAVICNQIVDLKPDHYDAKCMLGTIYCRGLGIERIGEIKQKGINLLTSAADAGHVRAAAELGKWLDCDDTNKAARLQMGHDGGITVATRDLAEIYNVGLCVKRDETKAKQLYQMAFDTMNQEFETGSYRSASKLALMYLNGEGTRIDLEKGEAVLSLAADHGEPDSANLLSSILCQQARNLEKALKLAEFAADHGRTSAISTIVRIREKMRQSCPARVYVNQTLTYNSYVSEDLLRAKMRGSQCDLEKGMKDANGTIPDRVQRLSAEVGPHLVLLTLSRNPREYHDRMRTCKELQAVRDNLRAEGFSFELRSGGYIFVRPDQHALALKALELGVQRLSSHHVLVSPEYENDVQGVISSLPCNAKVKVACDRTVPCALPSRAARLGIEITVRRSFLEVEVPSSSRPAGSSAAVVSSSQAHGIRNPRHRSNLG